MNKWRTAWTLILLSTFLVLFGVYWYTTFVFDDFKNSDRLPASTELAIELDRFVAIMPYVMLAVLALASAIGFKCFRSKWWAASVQAMVLPATGLGWIFVHAGIMKAKNEQWRQLHLALSEAQVSALRHADFVLDRWLLITLSVLLVGIALAAVFAFFAVRDQKKGRE